MKKLVGIAFLVLAASVSAAAQSSAPRSSAPPSEKLFHSCEAAVNLMDANLQAQSDSAIQSETTSADYCTGYFTGMADVVTLEKTSLCISDASIGTMIRVYVAYMVKSPKLLDDPEIAGVLAALKGSYACPAKQ